MFRADNKRPPVLIANDEVLWCGARLDGTDTTRKNLADCCEAVGSTGATAATAGGPPEPEPEPGSDRPVGIMPAAFRTLMALYCWAIAVRLGTCVKDIALV